MILTVVLAVQGGLHLTAPWLHRFEAQRREGVEVLLVYASDDQPAEEACRALQNEWARAVQGPERALVPHLWAVGVRESSAERVALTVVHCQPPPGWLGALLGADLARHEAIGGPIEQGPGADAVGWAIYLQRYTPFTGSTMATAGPDSREIAGDNALYDRRSLMDVASSWERGFWELEVHRALRRAGGSLGLEPAMWTEHRNGYSVREFAEQRLRHGFVFGQARARSLTRVRRLGYRVLTPSIPALFGAKIAARSLGFPPARRHLIPALPWLALFVLAWSLGEAAGAQGAGP